MNLPDTVPNGVALWQDDGTNSNRQVQLAGFADVNGDGLLDRVVGHKAYLGLYAGTSRFFSSVYLTLPNQGYLSKQASNLKSQCAGHSVFNSRLTQGLRDLTGDGIPEYIDGENVYLGTGAGFTAAAVSIKSAVSVHLSDQPEMCEGQWSETDAGLYDVDGDGKPEWVSIDPGNHSISVAQLSTGLSARAAEVGRITDVGNGYGATTHLGYISGKQDLYSSHAVPFPEILLATSATTDDYHLGGRLSQSSFAYGNVGMQFDAQRDRFISSGYARTVRLQVYTGKGDQPMAMGTVDDMWQREPYTPAMCQNLSAQDCRTK
jgi:hypothetical protein